MMATHSHNPYEGTTEDDPNFVYKEAYERYHDLLNSDLPEGWKKGNPANGEKAPYVHEDGRVSWKNPNSAKIQAFLKEMETHKKEQEEQEMTKENNKRKQISLSSSWRHHPSQRCTIKKLRLMLTKAGAPLEVVERRAAVEGIDMALVLQHEEECASSQDVVAFDNNENNSNFPEPPASPVLLKKYKRMLKSGVPLPQVQQLAGIEAGMSFEQVVDHCVVVDATGVTDDDEEATPSGSIPRKTAAATKATDQVHHHHKHSQTQHARDRALTKLNVMYKSGVPLSVLEHSADMTGIGKNELMEALGLGQRDNVATSTVATSTVADVEVAVSDLPFKPVGSQNICFQASSDLATLVRKMAQSVHKSSRNGRSSSGGGADEMVVETLTLYHALGSFQGVQVARDRYNATTRHYHQSNDDTNNGKTSLSYLRGHRQAFSEMARSIGLALPKDVDTPVDVGGLDELVSLIEERYKDEIQQLRALLCAGFYDFESLAAMYPPGSRVLAKNAGGGGVDILAKVAWNRYEQGRTILGQPMKYFQLCLEYVVAVDSQAATICEVVEGMEQFEGKRNLTGGLLQFVPLAAYSQEQQDLMVARYRCRGQLYNRVAVNVPSEDAASSSDSESGKTYSYMAYQKGCFFARRGGSSSGGSLSGGNPSAALATDGRIIVDTQGAYDFGHSLSVGYDPMVSGIHYKLKEYKLQMRSNATEKSNGGASTAAGEEGGGMILFERVPDEYLEFVWPLVVGFSLSAKAWGDCLVDGLEDIVFKPGVFESLVLPESRKRLVQALVKHTGSSAQGKGSAFHDLIAGKGEGVIFLLHGPPGVGKTLTAEATAEVLKLPLYALSMGTMGTTADELERRFGDILKLSDKWDAIILLDEADAFLEARSSSSSLEQNAMVCVMLKLVEYFSGILFLTSNRLDSIDSAFKTRITLALQYDNLNASAREKIWLNLFKSSGIDVTTSGINTRALAESFVLNGREIKNALRLALALAAEEGMPTPSNATLMETSAMVGPYQDGEGSDDKKASCFFPWWN